jgi:beta-glucosidase
MKKIIKRILIFMFSIISIILLFIGYHALKFKYNVLDFENNFSKKINIPVSIKNDELTFIDRNGNKKLDVYEDYRQTIDERAKDILSKINIDEKIHLLKGSGMKSALGMSKNGIPGAVGTIVSTPRLGLPSLYLSDGPAGLRISPKRDGDEKTYYCTAFPIGTLLASTWNTDLVQEVGNAMGNEALNYGIDIILGPAVNIHRNPLCGRNFEYYSEDPILSGNIGAAMVNGIESNGVGTSVKHFIANNQETSRNSNNAIISERAFREIYLKGFEIIVKKSQPWTIMSSYNKVNGENVSESKKLLTNILRNEWGFEGVVMTDWFGGNDAKNQIRSGNDLLEPGTQNQWDELKEAYENGSLSIQEIDTSVNRILKLILKSNKMRNYDFNNNPDLLKHAEITRRSASEGMILLKNEGLLPLKNIKNIALIGATSFDFISGGTGSGDVEEAYTVSLEEALVSSGYKINEVSSNIFKSHFLANESSFKKHEGILGTLMGMLNPYTPPEIDYSINSIKELAKSADIAIITIGRNSGEGSDRIEVDDFLLSKKELKMIEITSKEFRSLGKKVVVVLNVGGVIETESWKKYADSILLAWQGGQEAGNSVTDILTGKVNPSGKLPMTFPVNLIDHASSFNFPMDGEPLDVKSLFIKNKDKPINKQEKNKDFTLYDEGIYVGYRHFDKANIDVSYPFGFGLSYTNFKYSDLQVTKTNDKIDLSVEIENTGSLKGKEIVQIYLSKTDSEIDRPPNELKAFLKTPNLEKGESIRLKFSIPISYLSYWSEDEKGWKVEPGNYLLKVGASSRDIRLTYKTNIL